MEKAVCLFCGSGNVKESFYPKVKFNNKVFVYKECQDCKLNFNDPLLAGDDYAALYPIQYHDEFYFKTKKDYSKQLSIVKKYPGIKTIVDYGCGDAGLLDVLSKNGFSCTGVEYSESLVARLRERFPAIKFFTVDEFNRQNEKYDCIHMGDVLEHMTDPNGIIQSLRARLNKDGYMFVEGPIEHNASLAYGFRKAFMKLRKKLSPHREVEGRPFHTFLANRQNQREMLEKNSFVTRYYSIYETGWPFPEKLKDVKSPKLATEYVIGLVSILGSKVIPAVGNRFYYLGQLKSTDDRIA